MDVARVGIWANPNLVMSKDSESKGVVGSRSVSSGLSGLGLDGFPLVLSVCSSVLPLPPFLVRNVAKFIGRGLKDAELNLDTSAVIRGWLAVVVLF